MIIRDGTLRLTSNAVGGSETLTLTSSAQTGTATIPAGTFIKFANHPKVYVTKNALSFVNGATDISMSIFPRLVETVTSTTKVNLGSECLITYKLDGTSGRGLSYADGILVSPGTVKIIEAL